MRLFGFISCLFLFITSAAQQPVYRHITEDDGLPDNEIYYLYQDRKGITWISTNSGLCRYNGQSFQYFSNPQLKAKSTGCIKEDAYGRIWVNNFTGQLFYVENDSLVIAPVPNLSSNAPFVFGPQNQLVATSEKGGLMIFRPGHTKKSERPNYIPDTTLQAASTNPFFSPDGTLWIPVTGKDDVLRDKVAAWKEGRLSFYKIAGTDYSERNLTKFITAQGNKLYLYQREQSVIYTFNGREFVPERNMDLPGFKMMEPLRNGGLAFCTNSGFYVSDEQRPAPAIITRLFAGQTISAFCQDGTGNLWVGTLTEGIYFIPALGLQQVLPNTPGIDYNNITAISNGPGNRLVLGFLNGEMGLLNETLQYKTLYPANKRSNKVQSLFYSPQLGLLNWYADDIYQSSFSENRLRLDPYRGVGYSSKDIEYIPKLNAALIANPVDIQLISLDQEPIFKRLPADWTAQYDTSSVFEPGMRWPQSSILFSTERGRAVHYDEPTETFWGADKNGIALYRRNGKSNILFNGQPIYATDFFELNGIVWTGTFQQGLFAIKNEQVTANWTVKDGLISNTVYQVMGSGRHLWIVTDKGLQYFDMAGETFFLVDKTLGLPSYKINGIALANGRLFISTPKGLLQIPDDARLQQDGGRKPYLQTVYCNKTVVDSGTTQFGPWQNDFIFKVETPVYSNRALLRYKYRLKGADKDFSITTLDNAVFEYKSLRSGSYQFELFLVDPKGNVLAGPVVYSFTIKPPFYKTAWFITLCILFIAAMVFFLVRKRIERIKKRAADKLQLAQMERDLKDSQLSGIKAQMNPHFMFNALNSIQEFILLNDKKQANFYMGKFADLMRMTLDMSNKKDVLLEDEIKMLELYLEMEALRFEEKFSYAIRVDENVDKETLRLPAMLIQPNVENAVKHGLMHKTGDKRLEVHFSMKDAHTLCCTVTDNGIGRKRSGEINAQRIRKHTSFATGATQKRLELLNYQKKEQISVQYEDLVDASGKATGTGVSIYIPV